MAVSLSGFPFATPYDPSKDPATSVDPLGTTSLAERLADLLLPGFTARMWRPRLLTFSAVAALVASKVIELLKQDDQYDVARLAFERLYVSALVQAAAKDLDLAAGIRRITGSDRARQALARGEPLTRANFIKGQSVNGPTGVMARLARNLRIVNDENHLDTKGQELILAWAKDAGLVGILEGKSDAGDGGKWLTQMAKATQEAVKGTWPGNQSSVWSELTNRLRPDEMDKHERKFIHALISTDLTGLRARMLPLLVRAVDTYNDGIEEGRTVVERSVLQDGVRSLLKSTDPVDKVLDILFDTIEAHEECSSLLLGAFDTIRWALSSKGTLTEAQVLADKTVTKNLERARKTLAKELVDLERAIARVEAEPTIDRKIIAPLQQMRSDVGAAVTSPEALLSTLLDRHRRVQKEKRKGEWIERGPKLTIMPSFGFPDDPPNYSGMYLHPFRISNAYAMLGELGVVKVGRDEEEE
ncbi:MAG: hypothetical protein H0U13_14525 [Gemmatimonadaceae bacterium]|nr:hypothetical protein [Gemmatimonadaceae bacterium]